MKIDLDHFLKLHAKFMAQEDPFADKALCSELFQLLSELDDPREIKNPKRSDGTVYGYVAVSVGHNFNCHGDNVHTIELGDVLVLQFAWDRNIIVTHWPISKCVPIPFLLRDTELRGFKGVWLPIFETKDIRRFAEMRVKKLAAAFEVFFQEEERVWQR